jgi:hypothetical protein
MRRLLAILSGVVSLAVTGAVVAQQKPAPATAPAQTGSKSLNPPAPQASEVKKMEAAAAAAKVKAKSKADLVHEEAAKAEKELADLLK